MPRRFADLRAQPDAVDFAEEAPVRRDLELRGAMRSLHLIRPAARRDSRWVMSDGDSTGLIGIAFWCIALAAFLLWALKHFDLRL